MKLTGILDNSLNGQLCLRGFANIKDLANISEADYSYQRGLIDRKDISDFLETQTYLFFPEVIMSYKIKFALKGKENEKEPSVLLQTGKNYKCNLSFDKSTFTVKEICLSKGNTEKIKIAELMLDESLGKQLHRIDGNHRLSAAEKSNSNKVNRMVIPFCLLLGTEYYDKNERLISNKSEKEFEKATKVFFHNINTKTIPLTSEENLRVMIDDTENFSDSELNEIFGGEYPVLTRQLIKYVNPQIFTNLRHIIEDNFRTFYNDIFQKFLESDLDKSDCVTLVSTSLQAVNTLYGETAELKANNSIGLLTAFLWFHIHGHEIFNGFKNWILNNHIFEVSSDITSDSLIGLYNKLISQEIKVFVAMPFFDGNPQVVADYNIIYDNKIKDLAQRYKVNISLYPIMCEKGATQDQIQDIINKIKKAKIIFADITDNNPNVLYEMGWARALEDKQVVIIRRKGSPEPKSDYKNDTYHEYDDSCRVTSLSAIIEDNILEILEKNYGLIKR